MKFSCDSCGAQYMIADEKIGRKGVKVRCKKCSFVIVLRPNDIPEPGPEATKVDASLEQQGLSASMTPSTVPPSSIDQNAFEDEDRTVALGYGENDVLIAPSVAAAQLDSHGFDSNENGVPDFGTDGFDEPLSDLGLSAQPELGGDFDTSGFESEDPSDESPFTNGGLVGGSLETLDRSVESEFGTGAAVSDDFGALEDQTRVEPQWSSESFEQDEPVEEGEQTVEHAQLSTTVGTSPFFGEEDAFGAPPHSDLSEEELATRSELASISDAFSEDEPLSFAQDEDNLVSPSSEEEMLDDPFGGAKEEVAGEISNEASESYASQEPDADSFENEVGAFDDGLGDDDPFGQIADRRADSGQDTPVEEAAASTRLYNGEAEKKVEEEWARAQAQLNQEPSSEESAATVEEALEWYLAIDDEQVGPLTLSDARDALSKTSSGEETLCWKQGMANWLAAKFVSELRFLVEPEPFDHMAVRDSDALAYGKAGVSESFIAPDDDPFGASDFGPASSDSVDDDDDDWQPKGSDLLASLVAAEEGAGGQIEPVDSINRPSDISFLGDEDGRAARAQRASDLFGANDVSAANINRPLSRASQVSGTFNFENSAATPAKGNSLLPAMVVGVCIIVAMIIFVLFGRETSEPPPQIAKKEQVSPKPVAAQKPPPSPAEPVAPKEQPTEAESTAETLENSALGKKPDEPKTGDESKQQAVVEKSEAPPKAKPKPKPRKKAVSTPKKKKTASRSTTSRREPRPLPRAGAGATTTRSTVRTMPNIPKSRPKPKPARNLSKDDLLGGAGRPQASTLPKTLDEAQLLKVIRKHKNAIRTCKSKQKQANPSLGGVMQVKLVIQKNGRTSKVSVAPPKFSGSTVGNCVISSVKSWRFPKFSGTPIPLDFPLRVKGSR
ncbi:MAG: AgmX/PglI C-terminal domain-containing protein [Myxococcota bacterium]|nr:AgmX/PglI C-terminal domain-containing protein [Myxococcota bacterium]